MSNFSKETNPIVTIEMETKEIIKLELYPQVAPESVNNFISLIQDGFYNGLIFHRVIHGFMIQGGDPQGSGTGGPGYSIKGEFAANGVVNNLSHTRGVLSFARSGMPNSAGSQFFIVHKDSPHLDGQYAAFGRIIEGIEVLDMIAESECNHNDKPVVEAKMKSVTVDTKGVNYPAPNKL